MARNQSRNLTRTATNGETKVDDFKTTISANKSGEVITMHKELLEKIIFQCALSACATGANGGLVHKMEFKWKEKLHPDSNDSLELGFHIHERRWIARLWQLFSLYEFDPPNVR